MNLDDIQNQLNTLPKWDYDGDPLPDWEKDPCIELDAEDVQALVDGCRSTQRLQRQVGLLTLYAQRLEAFHLPSDEKNKPHPIWKQLEEIE